MYFQIERPGLTGYEYIRCSKNAGSSPAVSQPIDIMQIKLIVTTLLAFAITALAAVPGNLGARHDDEKFPCDWYGEYAVVGFHDHF